MIKLNKLIGLKEKLFNERGEIDNLRLGMIGLCMNNEYMLCTNDLSITWDLPA
jgi:hypothetical protein